MVSASVVIRLYMQKLSLWNSGTEVKHRHAIWY